MAKAMRFKSFIVEAGGTAERQENGFVDAVAQAITANGDKPITRKEKMLLLRALLKPKSILVDKCLVQSHILMCSCLRLKA